MWRGFILYALGDSPLMARGANSRMGCLARIDVAKELLDGKPHRYINDPRLLPIYLYDRFESGTCVDFRLLGLRRAASGGSDAPLIARQQRKLARLKLLMDQPLPDALLNP